MDKIKQLFSSKKFKYGSNAVIMITAVVAIVLLVNILADALGMGNLKLDLTANKLYSIGDETKEILSGLDKEVTIYGLFDDEKVTAGDYKDVTTLLDKYDAYPKVNVEYVDPDKNPGFFTELDPQGEKDFSKSSFVVKCEATNKMRLLDQYDLFEFEPIDQYGFQTQIVGSTAEQGFTGAIKYVASEVTPTVYFLTGHDELELEDEYSMVKERLDVNNYESKSLNLFTSEKVPDDAEMIIIPSPKKDLADAEKLKLKTYLQEGGKIIFMFDYLESNASLKNFEELLVDFNVSINYDKVKENDENYHPAGDPYTFMMEVPYNSVIGDDLVVFMNNSRSVKTLKNQKDYITTTTLMKTSPLAEGEQVNKEQGENNKGPLELGIAVENKGGKEVSKIIVLGNASFISDNAYRQFGYSYSYNMGFFMRALSWMQDRKDEVIIAPKIFDTPVINISASTAKVVGVAVVVLLPLLILGMGTFVYLRRRHL